ncbi:hypothetical protein FRC01_000805 [Tulasnella sp. 417]|nr:hypothetical protein FRC01_000805 [Tulasnella sp. 417]
MSSLRPSSTTSPTVPRPSKGPVPSSEPRQQSHRAPAPPTKPTSMPNNSGALRRIPEQRAGKENRTISPDAPRDRLRTTESSGSNAKTSSNSDSRQPRRHPLQILESTDSESETPAAGSTTQSKNVKSVSALGLQRRRNIPEGETVSEVGDYVPPASKGSSKRKKFGESDNESGRESPEDEEGPDLSRRKTTSRPKTSSRSVGAEMSEDEEEKGEEDEEEENWDRLNTSSFSRREHRRRKAAGAKASTWIKAKTKDKKEKKNLICLSERGERDKWPEAWRALADECSQAVVQKIREVTGTTVGQKWSEIPNLDEEENEMLVIHFSAEAGMKDQRNVAFAKRVVALIREDEKQSRVLTAPGRHYISDKFLMQKTFKAINGFKRAWKAQTDEDLAKTIARRAKMTRLQGRQMTAAQNLQKGAEIFLEEEFPEEEARLAGLEERRQKLAQIGKQIIAAEWMSETESGPEDPVERKHWLEDIGKDQDQRGKPTVCYNTKGKGRAIYEVMPVTWRTEDYEWYLDQCRTAYESQHRIRTEERAYPARYLARLSPYAPPKTLINLDNVERIRENMESDGEKELFSHWGEDDDEDVAWFMKRIEKARRRREKSESGDDVEDDEAAAGDDRDR